VRSLRPVRQSSNGVDHCGTAALTSRERQTETCDVYGANQKRDPQDNVEDRCQNEFPIKRLASHTRRSALSRIDDTIPASRGTPVFNLLPKIIRESPIPADLLIGFDCACRAPCSPRAGAENADVDRHSGRSDRPKHRNTDCACSRRLSIGRHLSLAEAANRDGLQIGATILALLFRPSVQASPSPPGPQGS
jgi:hypothetical protein